MFLSPIRTTCLTMCALSLGGLMLDASRRDEQAARPAAASSRARSYEGWTHYGGSPDQSRYSSLRQIDKSNVSRLTVAWTYDSGETGGLQTQPIVVDDVLFGYTPTHKTFALRADTGERLWIFDPKIQGRGANRGLMYWSSGDDRRVFAAVDQYLYALDARTGQPIPAFAENGRIDLRAGLGRDPQTQSIRLTSPGVIFRDTVIIGGRVNEELPASPGDIRAYDVRTGKLKWAFHTIPHPGETGYETWSKDSWTINGGANSWPGMALDERRGIVYVPTGSAAADFYGGESGWATISTPTVCSRWTPKRASASGHFQFVRHDIWDRDAPVAARSRHPSPRRPHGGRGRPDDQARLRLRLRSRQRQAALSRSNTGSSLRAASPVRWQPTLSRFQQAPKPFARQVLDESTLTTRTPEAHRWAAEQLRTFENGGQFVPFSVGRQTVIFPGFDGGAEWGGSAFDPTTGVLYVNANDIAWTGGLRSERFRPRGTRDLPAALRELPSRRSRRHAARDPVARRRRNETHACGDRNDHPARRGPDARVPDDPERRLSRGRRLSAGRGGIRGRPRSAAASRPYLPYRFTGYQKFLDPEGYPAVAPPWGTLSAIDLNTGKYAWQIPLGEYPELAAKGMKDTGTENYGGPVVTAGGLVFIGATNFDRKFRAFDRPRASCCGRRRCRSRAMRRRRPIRSAAGSSSRSRRAAAKDGEASRQGGLTSRLRCRQGPNAEAAGSARPPGPWSHATIAGRLRQQTCQTRVPPPERSGT